MSAPPTPPRPEEPRPDRPVPYPAEPAGPDPEQLIGAGVALPERIGLEAELPHAAEEPGGAGPEEWGPTVPYERPHRPRSARTAVTALVVTCLLVLGGAALYDAIAERTGHAARQWRADLTRELATRHLDDAWVLGIAGGAAAAGLLLCWLAFAPGLRRWLPLVRPGAAIDRAGVAALLSARAAGIEGVERCTVKAGRRRAVATVTGSAEPITVEGELLEELAAVPLLGPYRLDLRIQPVRPARPDDRRHGHRRLAQEAPR
ncbi:DUF6286 domain-containing protein [Kitasatospora sp. DSM 101779]|uniref:DUF6286 domain-containing protein n=1 Tax=Kitasatospora sp. DSM 101779 TaxID=2853165 RepID=UPI0021D9BD0A|nr:DUF6286 domain-containing protein [Kitasatospora sp. DSM 101779]MCU7822288.1 hypothetical protein [Kitasatospora sp. DSM 101779]